MSANELNKDTLILDALKDAARLMLYYRPHDKYLDGSIIHGPSEILRKLHIAIAVAEGEDPFNGNVAAETALIQSRA